MNTTTAAQPPHRTAIGYARVSTDEQDAAAQVDAIRAACGTAGIDLLDVLVEPEDASGRSAAVRRGPEDALEYYRLLLAGRYDLLERRGYAELLRRVRDRSATVVVFACLDRLSRDNLELLLLERVFAHHGVAILSPADGGMLDTQTPGGRFLFAVRAAWAEAECAQTAWRTSARLRHMTAARRADPSLPHVGRPPVGWRMRRDTNDTPTGEYEHDSRWDTVLAVHAMREAGKTYDQIAAAAGISRSSVRAYINAATWQPPRPPAAAAAPADTTRG